MSGARLAIFDVDGVIYDYDRDVRTAEMGRLLDRTPDEVAAAMFGSGIEDRADAGELGTDDYLAALGERLGVVIPVETWTAARAAATRPVPEVLALVAQVAGRVPVATLTNNGVLAEQQAPAIVPELVRMEGVRLFYTGTLGVAKPEPGAFLAVADAFGVDLADAVFVDDSARNAEAARRAGMRAHHHEGVSGLRGFLVSAGLLDP